MVDYEAYINEYDKIVEDPPREAIMSNVGREPKQKELNIKNKVLFKQEIYTQFGEFVNRIIIIDDTQKNLFLQDKNGFKCSIKMDKYDIWVIKEYIKNHIDTLIKLPTYFGGIQDTGFFHLVYISDLNQIVHIGESNILNDVITYDRHKEYLILPLMQHIQKVLDRNGVEGFYIYRD